MSEYIGKSDAKSRPFAERVTTFNLLVQGIGIGVGGDAEYDIRALGRKIVKFHSVDNDEEREQLREEIGGMYHRLGESKNPRLEQAILEVTFSEISLF